MFEHTYSVTWITKDGQVKTETITARNHHAIERSITRRGGTMLDIDRDEEEMASKSQRFKHDIIGVILFVIVALAVIILWRLKIR